MDAVQRLTRRLTLRELHVLLTAAELGSLAKAGQQLALTQPAISRTVNDLEAKLANRLFDRTPRGVTPTVAGNMVLMRARNTFAELRYLMDELAGVADPRAGVLRIACGPIFAAGFLPAVIERLVQERPGIRYNIHEAAHSDVLRARTVDILVGRPPQPDDSDDIAFEQLFEEKLFIVAGHKHPLARRRTVSGKDLAHQRWILPYADTAIGHIVEPALAELGISANSVTVKSMSGLLRFSLLANGQFLTTLPASLLRFGDWRKHVRILPIVLPRTAGPVGLATVRKASLAPTARLFAQHAREVAKRMQASDTSLLARYGGRRDGHALGRDAGGTCNTQKGKSAGSRSYAPGS